MINEGCCSHIIIPNAVTKEECELIIRRGLSLPQRQAEIGSFEGKSHNDSVRRSTVAWFNMLKDSDIKDMIMHFARIFTREKFAYNITDINDIQFTTYHGSPVNGDHYDWHFDMFLDNTRPFDRKVSFILQLSNSMDYEGGKFEIGTPYHNVQPQAYEQGSVILFPSFVPHRVLPTTAGVRHSLVSWVEGPKFV